MSNVATIILKMVFETNKNFKNVFGMWGKLLYQLIIF